MYWQACCRLNLELAELLRNRYSMFEMRAIAIRLGRMLYLERREKADDLNNKADMKLSKVFLKPECDRFLAAGHPWIFSRAILSVDGPVEEGATVEVYSSEKRFLGVGHYGTGNIAVKMLSRERVTDEAGFYRETLQRAIALRRNLGLFDSSETNAFRLVHGEGDRLPGLIVDLYARTAVVQCQTAGMMAARSHILDALRVLLEEKLDAVFDRSIHVDEGSANEPAKFLWAKPEGQGPGICEILEGGLRFFVDCVNGQKTGFFLDQRENRALVRRYASGRTVLNAFCYTGAFSVYALSGGAKEVCSVDSAKRCLDFVGTNCTANAFADRHEEIAADCFDFLNAPFDRLFDLIILDPPAFVKHQKGIARGLRGYESINYFAMKQIAPGGILFTFSCSQLVQESDFRKIVTTAAKRARHPAAGFESIAIARNDGTP